MCLAKLRTHCSVVAVLLLAATAGSDAHSQPNSGNWQPLGVYSILSQTGRPTSRYLQLSANTQGSLRGVLRDPVSDTSQPLRGRIDPTTQQVRWSFDSNPLVTFRTSVGDLAQPFGTVEMTLAGGQRERWQIARQE